jgi:predicted amidohydrolase
MPEPLDIAVAQPRCVAHDVAANARAHAVLVREAAARVVVFPEMSLTGYEFGADPVAVDDPRLAPLVDACAATGTLALAGAPVPGSAGGTGGPVHIGILAVDGGGARVAYRKMCLGGGEGERFTPGPGPAVVEVDGWRLGLAVCKDTGVPEQAEATAALGIDAYVAGVLERAADVAVIAERAHRIATTHGVWVAIASFAGATGEGYVDALGQSGVWSPRGHEVARTDAEVGAVARATLT